MDISQLKNLAKSKIKGNVFSIFFSLLSIFVIMMIILFPLSKILNIYIIELPFYYNIPIYLRDYLQRYLLSIITLPLSIISIGISKYFLTLIDCDDTNYSDFFMPFKGGIKKLFLHIGTVIVKTIIIFLCYLLFIIPGIIKTYSYSQVDYIRAEHPEMGIMKSLKESKRMMKGHKGEFFLLQLSFIGWIFLFMITFGLAIIYFEPYMMTTNVLFYDSLKPKKNTSANTPNASGNQPKTESNVITTKVIPGTFKPKPKDQVLPSDRLEQNNKN